jgi:hypothetical protein
MENSGLLSKIMAGDIKESDVLENRSQKRHLKSDLFNY